MPSKRLARLIGIAFFVFVIVTQLIDLMANQPTRLESWRDLFINTASLVFLFSNIENSDPPSEP